MIALIIICGVAQNPKSEGQTPQSKSESQQQGQRGFGKDFPDLIGGLKKTKGCLGVEAAQTMSGKNVIFAWFESKAAALEWYHSDAHQKAMHMATPDPNQEFGEPLKGVPDDVGPIMAIASLTFAKEPKFTSLNLPVSQISIELYKPITGGIFLGGRFAPEGLRVHGMKDYTPKNP
jgi:hypothetical protein